MTIWNRFRAIAFYLPQYYPIPENDAQWGKGFTEWANVASAKPLFRGHHQPNIPADLGFYDLRVPEVRAAQADLARSAGIEGFCYWHYWFGNGRTVLERIFNEVLASGEPTLPFCLGWANESWTGRWHGMDNKTLIEQHYPGPSDDVAHFHHLLPAFGDPRYIEVEGKKLFPIYRPDLVPDIDGFTSRWNALAKAHGLSGFFFISLNARFDHRSHSDFSGFMRRNVFEIAQEVAAANPAAKFADALSRWSRFFLGRKSSSRTAGGGPLRADYAEFVKLWDEADLAIDEFPCVTPNWDNTPRCGRSGYVLTDPNPETFGAHVRAQLSKIRDRPLEQRLVFIKSWNEWAEGNHLEPNLRNGHGYLDNLRSALMPAHNVDD